MTKGTGKKIAIGTAIAGAAGYVAGILTAPKSGKKTRKDIEKAAVKTKGQAEKTLKGLHKDLNEVLNSINKDTKSLQGNVKTQATVAVKKATEAKEKLRGTLSNLHEGTVDDKELKAAVKEANESLKHLKSYVLKYEKVLQKPAKK